MRNALGAVVNNGVNTIVKHGACTFGHSARVTASHCSNSIWRAGRLRQLRDVGHTDRHVAAGGLMADAELREPTWR